MGGVPHVHFKLACLNYTFQLINGSNAKNPREEEKKKLYPGEAEGKLIPHKDRCLINI